MVRDTCLCLHLQRAARAVARRFDEALRPLGLTSGQFSLLMSLNRPQPPTIGHVAGVLAMDRTTLTANLKPLVRRSPEIMHGLNNLIQNAVQFARREVSVTIHWDKSVVTVEVADDGPGFPAHLLGRLGEPYLSTRAGASNHMGLGIFIAQSLLERSGADLIFDNLVEGGAHVVISWKRANLEADARPVAAAAEIGSDGARLGNERQTA